MTTQRIGSNTIFTTAFNLSGIGDGAFAHEWGHFEELDDVKIYTRAVEKMRLMYNGAPWFGRSMPVYTFAKPSYSEFKRANFIGATYLKVPHN